MFTSRTWLSTIVVFLACISCTNGKLSTSFSNSSTACPASLSNIVLGQPDWSTTTSGVSGVKMNGPYSAICVSNKIYVVDNGNNRILGWNSLPTTMGQPADFVLGQPDFTGVSAGTSTNAFSGPEGIASDGTRLFLVDNGNSRVLIWNSLPNSTGQIPDVVLGQPTFFSGVTNNGGLSGSSLYNPSSIAVDGSHLVVADMNNNRILIWNYIPTVNNSAANVVVGQASFGTNASGVSSVNLTAPQGVAISGSALIVADTTSHRVLIWNSIPTSNAAVANVVLGQSIFTTSTINNGGLSSQSLSSPWSVASVGSSLYVADKGNNRILKWNTIPTSNFTAAYSVYGQPTMTTGTANNPSASGGGINVPFGVFATGYNVLISDFLNNRLVIAPF